MVIFIKIIAIIMAIISAIFYFRASKIKLPKAPQKGELIEAKTFKDLFDRLNTMSQLNACGGISLFGSLVAQIITLWMEILNK